MALTSCRGPSSWDFFSLAYSGSRPKEEERDQMWSETSEMEPDSVLLGVVLINQTYV